MPIIISLSISAKPDRIGLAGKCVIFASFTTMRYITYTKNTMKKLFYSLLAVVLAACGSEKQAPIDREALVARNNPQVSSFDSLASLSIGNGEFAFTVDATGLQTFPSVYKKGVPLGTQSQWGWHSFGNPNNTNRKNT